METSAANDEEEEQPAAPSPAPDGGWGWIVVLAAFVIYAIADGCTFSFGIFYTELLDYFHQSKGKTAVIPGMLFGFPLLMSPIVCALATKFGCRIVGCLGGSLTGIAFFISIFAGTVEYLCFSIGLIGSFGLAMCYISAIVSVSFYFERRRGLATGLAVCGSGIGTLIFPPLLEAMVENFAWRGSILLVSGICFNMIIAAAAFLPLPQNTTVSLTPVIEEKHHTGRHRLDMISEHIAPRIHDLHPYHSQYFAHATNVDDINEETPINLRKLGPRRRASLKINDNNCNEPITESCPDLFVSDFDKPKSHLSRSFSREKGDPKSNENNSFVQVLKEIFVSMLDPTLPKNFRLITYWFSNFLLCVWYGVPYVYITDLAKMRNIDTQRASLVISIMGISNMLGQVTLGFLADKSGRPLVIYSTSMCLCGASLCFVPLCFDYWAICLVMSTYGFFIAANYALETIILINLVGLERMTTALGWQQLGQGVGSLIGMPIAGLIFDFTGEYSLVFYIAGAWIMTSGVILIPMTTKDECCKSSRKIVHVPTAV